MGPRVVVAEDSYLIRGEAVVAIDVAPTLDAALATGHRQGR